MKICLDAGHYGKYNRSPVNSSYYESEMTWKLHLYLKEELLKKGFEVITTRENQANDCSLESRGKKSKGCCLFLSIHSNASGNASANNSWACCLVNDNSTKIDDISIELGKILADKVTEIMIGKQNAGYVYRRTGTNGADYYGVLRGAKSVGTPAVLLEHGFHTNLTNTNWLLNEENLRKLAEIEAKTIADYFNVSSSSAVAPANHLVPYLVKIIDNCLNIRKEAGVNNKIVGTITNHAIYTIVEEQHVDGESWGKLKSGAGWINIDKKYCEKIDR